MPASIPLVVSGYLRDIAEGFMRCSGRLDFSPEPMVTMLPSPLGTGTGGWLSEFRAVGRLPLSHLEMDEILKPLEENGFLIMDLTPEAVKLRYLRWNQKTQPVEAIDTLEPFRAAPHSALHRTRILPMEAFELISSPMVAPDTGSVRGAIISRSFRAS